MYGCNKGFFGVILMLVWLEEWLLFFEIEVCFMDFDEVIIFVLF